MCISVDQLTSVIYFCNLPNETIKTKKFQQNNAKTIYTQNWKVHKKNKRMQSTSKNIKNQRITTLNFFKL